MAKLRQFTEFKKKTFTLRKEAVKWSKEQKAKHKRLTDESLKIDINLVKASNKWEAVLIRSVK